MPSRYSPREKGTHQTLCRIVHERLSCAPVFYHMTISHYMAGLSKRLSSIPLLIPEQTHGNPEQGRFHFQKQQIQAPAMVPLQERFKALRISRCAVFSLMLRRLSWIFLPRARAISTFARPRRKYNRKGTIVKPRSFTLPISFLISATFDTARDIYCIDIQ